MSRARNAGESAICPGRGQPSAEIARVKGAKCRRECDLSRSGATLCGSCASRARNAGESAFWVWRGQPSAGIVRVEGANCRLECVLARSGATLCGDRARRLCSTCNFSTRSNLWSWKLRTGDFVVQLESAEYLGSWKMRTGDFLVQL